MREILFKAKRIDNREWVEGYPVKYPSGKVEIFKECGEPPDILLQCEVDPETLCQCTGLKDKNGKRIWENDIVKYTDEITNKLCIDLIKYDENQASFIRMHESVMGSQYLSINKFVSKMAEVIGNIFDNPELLEQDGE